MGKADGLSRRSDWEKGTEGDNEEKVLLKPEWIKSVRVGEVIVEGVDILERIRKSKAKDDEVVKAVEEMKKAGVKMLRDEEWREEDGLMLKEGKVYVPKDEALRIEIIRLHHDTPMGGHGGQWKTVEMVTRNFWWPGVTREVKRYVEGCDACQRNKNRTEQPAGKLMPNSIPDKAWTHISADFITKLPLAQGYDSILVVVDRFTKMAHFVPTTEKTTAEGLARLFRDNVWRLHGLPESIISDRGPQFAAGLMRELNELLGIKTKLSTAFHPQTDGQTERINQELEQYLRMFIDHRQEQWPEWLGTAEFAYNNKVHTGTKVSPFQANSGQDPRMGFELRKKGRYEGAEKFAKKMEEVQREAKAALVKAQEDMRRYADRHRAEAVEYKVGDLVLLSTKDLKWQMVGRRSEKLTERFVGPYKIKAIISSNVVELELPATVKIHPVVNISRIRRYVDQVKGQRKEAPQPVIVEGEEEWEVEKILNKKRIRGKDKYLVRWKGFTAEGDTWESRENLQNAGDSLREFEEEYGRDEKEVKRQERVEENKDYWRGGFPGRYIARGLFGWTDGEYDRRYWQRLEKNWKRWKNVEPIGREKGRLTAVREVDEEEGGKIEEWNEEDEVGNMGDPTGEL